MEQQKICFRSTKIQFFAEIFQRNLLFLHLLTKFSLFWGNLAFCTIIWPCFIFLFHNTNTPFDKIHFFFYNLLTEFACFSLFLCQICCFLQFLWILTKFYETCFFFFFLLFIECVLFIFFLQYQHSFDKICIFFYNLSEELVCFSRYFNETCSFFHKLFTKYAFFPDVWLPKLTFFKKSFDKHGMCFHDLYIKFCDFYIVHVLLQSFNEIRMFSWFFGKICESSSWFLLQYHVAKITLLLFCDFCLKLWMDIVVIW